MFSDYLVFVDESGDHGMVGIDQTYPMFVLAFCIFRKQEYMNTVCPAVQQLKFKHWGHDADRLTHVVVERRGKREDAELELEFRRICDGANFHNCHLPFDIVMAPKESNAPGMQLADLVARPIGIKSLRPQQPNRAYDILETKFRRGPYGQIQGWGLKSFP